jgi:serine/threonine protein kinase
MFTITRVLGTGGLSVVYEGADKNQNRFAIKELICNFGGTKGSVENNLRQILNEVCILQSLDHPNIVKFRSFFAEGSKLYIVMDLIEGTNLRTFVEQQGLLQEAQLLDFANQCCSILHYLHAQRQPPIIHRDFTPDNLMLADGKLTLVDFNIAQSVTSSSSRTIMGKHCFMAPEQFCGQSNVSTDLYQLGTTLFYLATGTDPEPLTPCDVRSKRTDLSEELCAVIRRLTDRNPAQRFQSATEVVGLLASLQTPVAPRI